MVIDIGSNTVKYNVFARDETGNIIRERGMSTVLGFINYIKDGYPDEEGIDKLCEILKSYISESNGNYSVYATASFRCCRDPYYPIRKVYEKTGIKVRLLSGEEEAYYSLRGVLSAYQSENSGVMADMGGASTELNFFNNRKSDYLVSLPFGALKLLNRFAKRDNNADTISKYCSQKELSDIAGYVGEVFDELVGFKAFPEKIFLVGGSAKAIGRIIASEREFNGVMSVSELKAIHSRFCVMDEEKDLFLRKIMPDRFLLITPAVSAFIVLCEKMSIREIVISTSGIRDGYFDEIKDNENK